MVHWPSDKKLLLTSFHLVTSHPASHPVSKTESGTGTQLSTTASQPPGLAPARSPSTTPPSTAPTGTSQLANPALEVLLDAPSHPIPRGFVQAVLRYAQPRLSLSECGLPTFFCGQYIIYLLLTGSQQLATSTCSFSKRLEVFRRELQYLKVTGRESLCTHSLYRTHF